MADTNKLVSMIALVLSGLLIAAWGAIYIWLHRKDQLVIADLRNKGSISTQDAARLTNPNWMWVLSIVQIIIGIALIVWGVFQYFMKVDDVVVLAKDKLNDVRLTNTARNGLSNGSRRVFSTDFNGRID